MIDLSKATKSTKINRALKKATLKARKKLLNYYSHSEHMFYIVFLCFQLMGIQSELLTIRKEVLPSTHLNLI